MTSITSALAGVVLCCIAASTCAADAAPTCTAGRESALADGRVTVRPGETLCIRLRSIDGRVEPVAVVTGADTAGALVLQAAVDHGQTMLIVTNPLAATLKLRAWLKRPMRADAEATSTCPILAHLHNFETWPYAIGEIVLSGFELRPDANPGACD